MLILRKITLIVLTCVFITTTFGPVHAQRSFLLPEPGVRIELSAPFSPVLLKGIKTHADNPFQLEFIVDKGAGVLNQEEMRTESVKLIKYFLAALTVPENELWVNLSPYEKDRIVPVAFGKTEAGRDLLAQDYLLKQVTASLLYPENPVGKTFWEGAVQPFYDQYGVKDIPVETLHKVWIVPDQAEVVEKGDRAYIVNSHMKVMLENDYASLAHSVISSEQANALINEDGQEMFKKAFRDIFVPVLEREVNEGANFANLRQIYQSLVLAAWFKQKMKKSLLGRFYVDQHKVSGVSIGDTHAADKIWAQYVRAINTGVYNFVREEVDPVSREIVPRHYFAGGFDAAMVSSVIQVSSRDQIGGGEDEGLVFQFSAALDMKREGVRRETFTGRDIFDPSNPDFQSWYDQFREGLGSYRENVIHSTVRENIPPLAVHLMNTQNTFADIIRLVKGYQQRKRTIIEVGAGNTKNTAALVLANKDATVLGLDLFDESDANDNPSDYQEYGRQFRQRTLLAQQVQYDNVHIIRAGFSTITFLPDKSVDDVVMVMPAFGILKDLIVTIREFGGAAKFRENGRLIILMPDKNHRAIDLLKEYFDFEVVSADRYVLGVNMFANSVYTQKEEYADVVLFIGTVRSHPPGEDAAMQTASQNAVDWVKGGVDFNAENFFSRKSAINADSVFVFDPILMQKMASADGLGLRITNVVQLSGIGDFWSAP